MKPSTAQKAEIFAVEGFIKQSSHRAHKRTVGIDPATGFPLLHWNAAEIRLCDSDVRLKTRKEVGMTGEASR